MNIKPIAISLTVLALTACATKAPVQEVQERPEVTAPPPVTQEARPTLPPVVQAPSVVQGPTFDPNAPVPGSIEDFAYQSGGEPRVYFGYNRYDLTEDARNALRNQAQWLQSYSNFNAIVEGNADERGTREYNLALGARRADSVKAFLVSQGVSPSRLTTVSYGKERPIDGRSNEAGWSRNRNGHTNITVGSIG
ncbi:peptidoglycan-associated lipoprotein Pal [Hellea sp.]|nr:peptidoglycan-associated lipoprotein Pal [Hellea sp.]